MRAFARSATAQTSRGFRTTAVRRAGAGGGYDYIHAKHMYNLKNDPPSKFKVYSLIGGGVFLGIFIPIAIVDFSQRKGGYPPLLSLEGYKERTDEDWE